MLDHVSITVDDLDRAQQFYDAVMTALSIPKVSHTETNIGYGARCTAEAPDLTYLSINLGDKSVPTPSRHLCFKASSRAAVDAFWQAGIDHGGTDDGAPGIRENYHPTYYGAFLVDTSGNRIEAVCHRAES